MTFSAEHGRKVRSNWNVEETRAELITTKYLASRLRRRTTAVLLTVPLLAVPVVTMSGSAGADPEALPTDAAGLLAKLGETSRQAEENAEKVKELEDKLNAANQTLEQAQRTADEKTAAAQGAAAQAEEMRGQVNSISQSRYRRVSVDPTTAYIGAANPQDAIDRSAYLSALAADAQKTIDQLQSDLKEADQARDAAEAAKAGAKFQADQLKFQKEELDKQQKDLQEKTDQIRKAVDSLNASERASWVNKNGPVELSKAEIASISGDGSGVVSAAMTKLGSPYSWGATGPNAFDCSGLVVWAYAQNGKKLPRTSQAQMAGGVPVSRADLQPGDVVGFYGNASHVGIYIGNGRIVHASDYGIPVQVVSLDSMPWYGARRY